MNDLEAIKKNLNGPNGLNNLVKSLMEGIQELNIELENLRSWNIEQEKRIENLEKNMNRQKEDEK